MSRTSAGVKGAGGSRWGHVLMTFPHPQAWSTVAGTPRARDLRFEPWLCPLLPVLLGSHWPPGASVCPSVDWPGRDHLCAGSARGGGRSSHRAWHAVGAPLAEANPGFGVRTEESRTPSWNGLQTFSPGSSRRSPPGPLWTVGGDAMASCTSAPTALPAGEMGTTPAEEPPGQTLRGPACIRSRPQT